MKFLIYSDCHFSQYSSIVRGRGKRYSVRLHNLIDSISWAEHMAESNNCDEVICLGDFFNSPSLNAEEITALQDVYFSKLPHTFLTGNHDSNVSSLDFSSIKIFKSISAKVITDIEKVSVNDKVDMFFIPYLTGDKIKPISDFISGNKKKVILSHNDLAGVRYGRIVSSGGFNVNDIVNNCSLFLNGHLHNSGVIENKIILVGNLTGQNFNEDALRYDHYCYIMDIEDDGSISLDPYVNPHAFNFYKLYITKPEDLEIFKHLKNNSVLSISCVNSLLDKVNSMAKNNHKVIEYRIFALYAKSNDDEEIVDFTVEDHFQQFIKYVQTKIAPSDILTEELSKLTN